jgi:hypothetical protein
VGLQHLRKGRFDEAIRTFEPVGNKVPTSRCISLANLAIGRAYELKGDYIKAAAYYMDTAEQGTAQPDLRKRADDKLRRIINGSFVRSVDDVHAEVNQIKEKREITMSTIKGGR